MEGHGLLADALRAVAPRCPRVERVRAMGRAYYAFGWPIRGYYALMFSFAGGDAHIARPSSARCYTLMLLRDAVRAASTGRDP